MKYKIILFFMHIARLLCMNEPYFYLTLIIPCFFIFFILPPSLLSAVSLIVAHYICWNYIMVPIFEKVANMEADRIEIENEIRAYKIKHHSKNK